jgi:hypothetical protein
MAVQTFTRLYDSHDDAVQVVQALEQAGVPHADVSLVANNADTRYGTDAGTGTTSTGTTSTGTTSTGTTSTGTTSTGTTSTGTTSTGLTSGDPAQGASTGGGTGASVGTLLGGGAGLMAGLGALAIPGIGPIVAAGWLVATLAGAGIGAAAGGLLGSLAGAGVSEADAHTYAEGVRRGGNLVTVRADEGMAARVNAVLDGRTPVDPTARRAEYEQAGWKGFDPAAPAYSSEQVVAERKRRIVGVS